MNYLQGFTYEINQPRRVQKLKNVANNLKNETNKFKS